MLARWIRVKRLVPTAGGLSARPFAPDATDRGRFPPRIRLEATLLGASMGVLDMRGENGVGHILNLSVHGPWPRGAVVGCLMRETEEVARLAGWNLVVWELPSEETGQRAWAQSHGFTAADQGFFQKSMTRDRYSSPAGGSEGSG
jgi:hypothetical protein